MPLPNPEWTKEEIAFLKDNWGYEPKRYIARELNKSLIEVKKKGNELHLPKVKSLEIWGRKADSFLIANYKLFSNIELAKKLNELFPYYTKSFTATKVNSRLVSLDIKRTIDERKKVKRNNVLNGCMKGKKPSRELPIGHIRYHPTFYNYDGIRMPAYIIKVSEHKWQLFKHFIWEMHWGPIPKGFQVSVTNGDELNFTIEELVLTRKRGSMDKAVNELSDNVIMGYILLHREDRIELKKLYKENPKAFASLIENYRTSIILNKKIHGKKKNK